MCESENEAHKVAWIAEACRVQGYRQRNSLHVTIQGAENKEVPGRGPPQEDSRLVSPVRARGGAKEWTDGCLGGRMPLGSS